MAVEFTEEVLNSERYIKTLDYWQNLNKVYEGYFPTIPHVHPSDYKNIIIPAIIRCGGIPKDQLKVGKTYIGECRNAGEAVWLGDKFEYQRYKFGETFPEKINHFEDDNGYDLFIPFREKTE